MDTQNLKDKPPLTRLPRLVRKFMQSQSAGGSVMIIFAILAIIAANSEYAEVYQEFIETDVNIAIGSYGFSMHLDHFVKDILMVFFFFIIGMELKREIKEGFLSERNQIILPLIAAVGGMLAPALIFFSLNSGDPEAISGWAVPSATDIAFALCILYIFGKKIPPSVRIFLLAIAIFDDLGAILIIALFYSSGIHIEPLAIAGIIIACMFLLNSMNVVSAPLYVIGGAILVPYLEHAGIHTTIAGVVTGLLVPLRNVFDKSDSPLNRIIHHFHNWVTFIILPLFAFVSAGVYLGDMSWDLVFSPVCLGVMLGLFLGKQIGVFGATFASVKLGFAKKPEGANWLDVYMVSIIAGIGFTMSLFIAALAYHDNDILLSEAKLGIILGSLLSSIVGAVILQFRNTKRYKVIMKKRNEKKLQA